MNYLRNEDIVPETSQVDCIYEYSLIWGCYLHKWPNNVEFSEKIALENCFFIKEYFNRSLPTVFKKHA